MFRFRKTGAFVLGVLLLLTIPLCSTSALAADYTILKNDSLHKISLLFNTPVSTIKANNNLKSNRIYPGQVLNIKAKTYKVKKGDTLYGIAKKNNVTLAALRRANNKWNNKVKTGQKLLLPAAKSTAKSDSKATAKASTVSATAKKASEEEKAVISYTNKELDLLARLITAEATGEPYNAMVGVGAVVVNRVQSKEWPSTIDKVINHVAGGYYQFTPVKNGYIEKPASDSAVKAAKAALKGSDPSKGAMFYFDDSSTNEWLWSKTITANIGSMVFVK